MLSVALDRLPASVWDACNVNTKTCGIPDGTCACMHLPVVLTLPLDDLAQLAHDVPVLQLQTCVCWCATGADLCYIL